jgi:UDP-2,4-diacetamido-2,4,6-trideoxy-beta-L-altropyranose hydrolase
MRIAFRVDGGIGIGLGHINRSLVLASFFKKYADVIFISQRAPAFESGVKLICQAGFEVILFDSFMEFDKVSSLNIDILITDSYLADASYLKKTSNLIPLTGVIDDNAEKQGVFDFLINHNYYAKEFDYSYLPEPTELFLGHKYLMLRPIFFNSTPIEVKEDVENVLITVGGSDDFDITSQIINFLSKHTEYSFNVVIGPAFKKYQHLLTIDFPNIKMHVSPDMPLLMGDMDIAISSCGTTVYELMKLGIPTIAFKVADNQDMLLKTLTDSGLALKLDSFSDITKLLEELMDYRTRNCIHNEVLKEFTDSKLEQLVEQVIELFVNKQRKG